MQTREMWNRNKWRVVASAATLTALGVTGLALAETDDDTLPADGIILDDLQTVDTFDSPDVVTVDPVGVVSDLDSPLDDDVASVAEDQDSPDVGVPGVDESPDSPDDATAGVDESPDTDSPDADSPDADSPDTDSPDADSPDTDSPDDDDTSS